MSTSTRWYVTVAAGLVCFALLVAPYPGSVLVLLAYLLSAVLLVGSAAALRPSFLTVVAAAFLTLGFTIKLVAHLTFGAALIEPVGSFTGTAGQWDTALAYATAGQLGFAAAIVAARLLPLRYRRQVPGEGPAPARTGVIVGALVVVAVVSAAVYAANYRFNILRIGYPSGIDLGVNGYLVASFVISWGALLGTLALTQWLVERGRLPAYSLLVAAMLVGVAASVTMGSRIQYLLYILAACVVLVAQRHRIGSRVGVALALVASVLVFGVSLVVVSLQRDAVFTAPAPDAPGASASPGSEPEGSSAGEQPPAGDPAAEPTGPSVSGMVDVASDDRRSARMLREIRSLVVMRWVGLEAVLTTAGEDPRRLDPELLADALTEDPAAGTEGIYQEMSKSPYDGARGFTFLTLPGVVGVGSFSGSLPLVFLFVMVVVLGLHVLEVVAARLSDNLAVGAVAGVSLAYLVAQMGFPWTLVVYGVELALASAVLAAAWLVVRRRARARTASVDAPAQR